MPLQRNKCLSLENIKEMLDGNSIFATVQGYDFFNQLGSNSVSKINI